MQLESLDSPPDVAMAPPRHNACVQKIRRRILEPGTSTGAGERHVRGSPTSLRMGFVVSFLRPHPSGTLNLSHPKLATCTAHRGQALERACAIRFGRQIPDRRGRCFQPRIWP